ncbi:hypothetical protein NXX23_21005 [Bacteroides ovatus]|nr:hypothetical protein [Bacteroides ovatus]
MNLQAQIPSNPIRGKVTCNGTGVPGVVVTDGIDCVLTDQQGQYTLPLIGMCVSFIYPLLPDIYRKTEQTIPLFYQKLNSVKQDIYDFELVRNPQNEINHLFLVQADAQVTSEDDVKAYAKYLQDMKEYIRPYMGKKRSIRHRLWGYRRRYSFFISFLYRYGIIIRDSHLSGNW